MIEITADGIEKIRKRALAELRPHLAYRDLIDVRQSKGWHLTAAEFGVVEEGPGTPIPDPVDGAPPVQVQPRHVYPYHVLRCPFAVLTEVVMRGDVDSDERHFADLVEAARTAGRAEGRIVLQGHAGVRGIGSEAAAEEREASGDGGTPMAEAVGRAVSRLREAAPGDLAVLLPARWELHWADKKAITDPIGEPIRTPALVDYGLVLRRKAGDFHLRHAGWRVRYEGRSQGYDTFPLEESLAFRVARPAAAVRLLPATA